MPIALPLVALDVLVVALWCIALALGIALVMDKLSAILSGVPWVGGKLSDAAKSMAKAIANAAGTLESGIDALVGGAWHALARYMDKLWHQLAAQSSVLLHIAKIVGHLVYTHSGLSAGVKAASRVAHAALKLAHALERKYNGIEHRVKTIEREIGAGIGNDVRAHVKALERELHGIEKRVIPGLRQGIQAAEGEVSDLERWLGVKAGLSTKDWATALVLTALGALGLGGLRCDSLGNVLGKRGCGLWSDLDELLGLAALAVGALNFEELVRTAQDLTEEGIRDFQDVFGL